MFLRMLSLIVMLAPTLCAAKDGPVRLAAPQALVDSGLLRHALPRFSLKTQTRVELVPETAEADIALGDTGRAIFQGPDQLWKLEVRNPGHSGATRLADWFRSDVGQRTIASYAPDGAPLFGPPGEVDTETAPVDFGTDAELGHRVSREKCTRCHAVDAATTGWGIGSTPSFGVLRALPDWDIRFATFYVLNPHPAFTQIEDVTPPFPIDRPSPIAPVELTLQEVEAMLAYVAAMPATDLGQPLAHQ